MANMYAPLIIRSGLANKLVILLLMHRSIWKQQWRQCSWRNRNRKVVRCWRKWKLFRNSCKMIMRCLAAANSPFYSQLWCWKSGETSRCFSFNSSIMYFVASFSVSFIQNSANHSIGRSLLQKTNFTCCWTLNWFVCIRVFLLLLSGLIFFKAANDGERMFDHLKFCIGIIFFLAYTQIIVPILACKFSTSIPCYLHTTLQTKPVT